MPSPGSRSLTFILDLAIADSRSFALQLERLGHKRASAATNLYKRLVDVQKTVLASAGFDELEALGKALRKLAEVCVEELTPLADQLREAARLATEGPDEHEGP